MADDPKKKKEKKKRGRPRKVLPWVLRLGDDQSKWNVWFRSAGNPIEMPWAPPDVDVEMRQQKSLPPREHDIYGRRTRPTKDIFGESPDHKSITQPDDPLTSFKQELAVDERIALPAPWLRYLEYMDIIFELQSPGDQGAALKKLALEDARSRHMEEQPIDLSCAGTPEEFRTLCEQSRVEIQLDTDGHIINVIGYPLLPDNE